MSRTLRSSAVLMLLSMLALRGQTPEPGALTRDAMQLLKAECFSCHNEKKQKGGLVLTSREALLKGSDSGSVVAPGDHASSLLTKAILADADPHMPPKKQL